MKKKVGIIIYANPDYYPPVIRAINILAKEFEMVVIARNQDKTIIDYPKNVRLFRLGRLKSAREKEKQSYYIKVWEYMAFVIRGIFCIRFYRCKLIYSYDMYGFISGFIASRVGKKINIIYHNLDVVELEKLCGLSRMVKYLELRLVHYAEKVVFCDINRARYYQKLAKLPHLPDIAMNTPLCIGQLPTNSLREILEQKGFDSNTKVVLYQGAINEWHSILEILKSMSSWPKDTVLVLTGYLYEDFMEEFWREAKALNLTHRIIHLPFVSYVQIFSYTVGAYIGLALYKPKDINNIFMAGASNKIFEYLSVGVPVITNDSPYFREVLDPSYAYFVNPDSIEDIAKAINLAFYDQEGYRRKSQAARQVHFTKFNYERQFKPIIEYIREVSHTFPEGVKGIVQ